MDDSEDFDFASFEPNKDITRAYISLLDLAAGDPAVGELQASIVQNTGQSYERFDGIVKILEGAADAYAKGEIVVAQLSEKWSEMVATAAAANTLPFLAQTLDAAMEAARTKKRDDRYTVLSNLTKLETGDSAGQLRSILDKLNDSTVAITEKEKDLTSLLYEAAAWKTISVLMHSVIAAEVQVDAIPGLVSQQVLSVHMETYAGLVDAMPNKERMLTEIQSMVDKGLSLGSMKEATELAGSVLTTLSEALANPSAKIVQQLVTEMQQERQKIVVALKSLQSLQ